jgi:hypothetical protein
LACRVTLYFYRIAVVETVKGGNDIIKMARPYCVTAFGSSLEKMIHTGNSGATVYSMDAEVALIEASFFLAPDSHAKACQLLHTSGDEEEERKASLKQTRVHDHMLGHVDGLQQGASLAHRFQCEPTDKCAEVDLQVRDSATCLRRYIHK